MRYMTIDEFVRWVANYYVPYNKVQEFEVRDYLNGKSGEFIERLKEEVKYSFSGQYKSAPDVAILVKNSQRAYDWLRYNRPRPKLIEEGAVDCTKDIEELKKVVNITDGYKKLGKGN